MVGVGVGISPPRYSRNYGVMMGESGQLQITGVAELRAGNRARCAASAAYICRSQVMREIVLGHNLERLLKDLPEFDGLIVCRQKIVRGILPPAPLNLVDLLLDLQRLEVIELGLVGLELGMELVFARFFLSRRVSNSLSRRNVWLPN
jgi:hypothetical protein